MARRCVIENCNGVVSARDMCGSHLSKSAMPRDYRMAYMAAHKAVSRCRGAASAQTCECGSVAKEWALCGSETDVSLPDLRYPFNLDPMTYVAMCKPCHIRHDKTRNR